MKPERISLTLVILTIVLFSTGCGPTPTGIPATQPSPQITVNYAQLEADAQAVVTVAQFALPFLPPADQAAGMAVSNAIQAVLNKLQADRASGLLSPTQPDLDALVALSGPNGLIAQLEHLNTKGASASAPVKAVAPIAKPATVPAVAPTK